MTPKKTADSPEPLEALQARLAKIDSLPHLNQEDKKVVLNMLSEAAQDLDRVWLAVSHESNIFAVHRAVLIGRMCIRVKDKLLHGEWTTWAAENFTEDIRTVQKFMTLARSAVTEQYAYLGTERCYQLTKLQRLQTEEMGLPTLFTSCGLNADFEGYSCKEFEGALRLVLNRETLREHDIDIPNESLLGLTRNFNLIENNLGVLTRLMEAKSEEANMEKVVRNIVATAGGKTSVKKKNGAAKKKIDINYSIERFIKEFSEAKEQPKDANNVKEERLRFIVTLIGEYLTGNYQKST